MRDAIGPDVQLALDVNAAYDVEACIEYANAAAEYDIAWLEEPLHWCLQPADNPRRQRRRPINVGPLDLAMSLGLPSLARTDVPEVQTRLDLLLKRTGEKGIHVM